MKKSFVHTILAALAVTAVFAGMFGCSGPKSPSEQAVDFAYGLAHNDAKVNDLVAPDYYVSISGQQSNDEYWDGNNFPAEALSDFASLPRNAYQVASANSMMGQTEVTVLASTDGNAEFVRLVVRFGEGSKIVSCKGHMGSFRVSVYKHGT